MIKIYNNNRALIYTSQAETLKKAVENAVKEGVDLRCANLSDLDLSGPPSDGPLLSWERPRINNLRGVDLRGVDLTNVNFTLVDLRGARLNDAKLTNVNFSEAYLEDTNFTNANLTNANLRRANLSGTKLLSTNIKSAILMGVKGIEDSIIVGGTRSDGYQLILNRTSGTWRVQGWGMDLTVDEAFDYWNPKTHCDVDSCYDSRIIIQCMLSTATIRGWTGLGELNPRKITLYHDILERVGYGVARKLRGGSKRTPNCRRL